MPQRYHVRSRDREIKSKEVLQLVLAKAPHVALAMADKDEPYIVPLNYLYEAESNSVYFHCAAKGKKLDYMRRNPRVWGLAVIDHGLAGGNCENQYASVVFSGSVSFVEDRDEKLRILRKQILTNPEDPEKMLARIEAVAARKPGPIDATVVGKILIEEMTGKSSILWPEDKLPSILAAL